MELFFTDRRAQDRPVPTSPDSEADSLLVELPPAVRKAFSDLAIPDGMPFFLGDDGDYVSILNKFFRDIASDGSPSPDTWRGYARDIHTFSRFLDERMNGKRLLAATKDDLRTYFRIRCMSIDAISVRSWNRSVAALDRFYRWALENGQITQLPFDYRYGSTLIAGQRRAKETRRNQFTITAGRSEDVKCISLADYLVFRDVGLLGRRPDGSLDPTFRGRNALRNAAFAELLVTTGARLSEGACILKAELPDMDAPNAIGLKTHKMQLARLTTKGSKGRTLRISHRLMKDFILPYIQEDRDNSVAKAMMMGAYRSLEDAMPVEKWEKNHCRLIEHGKSIKAKYNALAPGERARMFTTDEDGSLTEPGLLWCTETGLPTVPENFQAVFERGCERCARFGYDFDITPHTLRHTFAVNMLSELIRLSMGEGVSLREQRQKLSESAYRRIMIDPLDQLRRLLGHSSITSTYIYLTYLDEVQELADEAINSWSDRLVRSDQLQS